MIFILNSAIQITIHSTSINCAYFCDALRAKNKDIITGSSSLEVTVSSTLWSYFI